jgi:hypothetical protein
MAGRKLLWLATGLVVLLAALAGVYLNEYGLAA